MRKRLLIVTDEMEIGGSQRQILEIARSLDPAAFEVHVVYFRTASDWIETLRDAGIQVDCIHKRHRLDPVFLWRFCRFLRHGDFDLIHAFSFSGELWSWAANALAGRARLITSIRGVYLWYGPLHWWLKAWVTKHSAAVVANSHAGAEYAALRMGIRRSRIDVVYNAIRPNGDCSQPMPDTGGAPRIVFVGRLESIKNLPCLLRAVKICTARYPDLQLDIVGEGSERPRLEALSRSLAISSNVRFLGQRSPPTEFIRAARCLVLPSHCEGLSNTLLEAMAVGKPVIASNVGGNPELVAHEVNGLLFTSNDESALAEALEQLLADRALAETMGQAGRRSIHPFQDVRRMTGELTSIYQRCLVSRTAWLMER